MGIILPQCVRFPAPFRSTSACAVVVLVVSGSEFDGGARCDDGDGRAAEGGDKARLRR